MGGSRGRRCWLGLSLCRIGSLHKESRQSWLVVWEGLEAMDVLYGTVYMIGLWTDWRRILSYTGTNGLHTVWVGRRVVCFQRMFGFVFAEAERHGEERKEERAVDSPAQCGGPFFVWSISTINQFQCRSMNLNQMTGDEEDSTVYFIIMVHHTIQ